MCGRFALKTDVSALKKLFNIEAVTCDHAADFNIAPADEVSAVIYRNGRRLGKLRWGLIPFWANDPFGGTKFINARSETLDTKPSFAQAFKKRRCLIPADGFYEWKRANRKKYPWFFTGTDEKPFLFAGIWDTWKKKGAAPVHSCAVITAEASESVSPIHDRMPVILKEEVHDRWLDPGFNDMKRLKEILEERVRLLRKYRVSSLVNSVKQSGPELIRPIDSRQSADS